MTNDELIKEIIKDESSKFTNNPADRGGPTKYGITHRTLSSYLGRPATVADVASLTEKVATDIYEKLFLEPIKDLPDSLRRTMMHTGVLRGPKTAIIMLQDLLGTVPDGVIGPKTLAAIDDTLFWNYCMIASMLLHFDNEVQKNRTQRQFLDGWRARFLRLR